MYSFGYVMYQSTTYKPWSNPGFIFISCVWVIFVHLSIYTHTCICNIYLHNTCVPGAHEVHRKPSEPFELELQKTVSHSLSAGNQAQILQKHSENY